MRRIYSDRFAGIRQITEHRTDVRHDRASEHFIYTMALLVSSAHNEDIASKLAS